MGTPPTFVSEQEGDWTSVTSPQTKSITVAEGEWIVVGAVCETDATMGTPTGGGLTYNLEQSILIADYCAAKVWTAFCSSDQTFTISVGSGTGGTSWFGFNVLRFAGCEAIGASAKTNVASGAPSLGLTTIGDNSAVVVFVGDWNATDGASRTWRTINGITPSSGGGDEVTYFRNSIHYAVYAAYWSDVGPVGTVTTGLSAPGGQKYAIIAVEVRGSPESGPRRRPALGGPR